MEARGCSTCQKITVESLCEIIRPGDRIFISSGAATPHKTISTLMESNHGNLFDLEIMQLAIPDAGIPLGKKGSHKYRWKTFKVGQAIAHGISRGNVDFIPATLAEIPYLFSVNAMGINVAVVQTSLPDRNGFMSLGIAADVADIVIRHAPFTVAEMNPHVPITRGETSVHIDQFDACIESDSPLLEKIATPHDDIADRIGGNVANLIEDGSTVALDFGEVFDAVAEHLKTKKNLRICSHTVSDWVISLFESGALALDRGADHQGTVMTSYCLGSSRLYEYVNQNPFFSIVPLFRTTYQATLAGMLRLVSIVHAGRVDITGNTITLEPDNGLFPGIEGKLAFSMASSMSRRGKPIVAVRSLNEKGESNIAVTHDGREEVRTMLGTTRYVVTEYGIASLAGKSMGERALAVIDIAHPDYREALIEEAREAGYIDAERIYATSGGVDNALPWKSSSPSALTWR